MFMELVYKSNITLTILQLHKISAQLELPDAPYNSTLAGVILLR